MLDAPDIRWAEEEELLPFDYEDQANLVGTTEAKPTMPGGTIDWDPSEQGAFGRLPDESAGPLPIAGNAAALGYTTPGEIAALNKKPHRITYFSIGETYIERFAVTGERVIPPLQPHPAGLMSPFAASASVSENTPGPITSELVTPDGTAESDFLSSIS